VLAQYPAKKAAVFHLPYWAYFSPTGAHPEKTLPGMEGFISTTGTARNAI